MIFFSYYFTLFSVVFFTAYWAFPSRRIRRWLILAACLCFYAGFAGSFALLCIIALATGTYLAGLTRDRRACMIWIGVCVAALAFYKYTYFLSVSVVGAFAPSLGVRAADLAQSVLPAVPPLGVSIFNI
jgi:D-alanyl-lipoteichoic acid acyltransferase DltB (MBOAT superfamily)